MNDDRFKQIMQDLGQPNSRSLYLALKQVANETGLPLIDVYTPMLDHPEYFPDGVHPNNEGAQIIANTIYYALTSNSK